MRSTIASRVVSFGVRSTCRSCGRTQVSPKRFAWPTNDITNGFAGRVVQLARSRDLLDAALVHHDHLVGDLHRLFLVVRDEDSRRVRLVVQPAQPDAQLRAHARVERAERLVEQQHLGLGREGAGERHALPLATGELCRVPVAEALQLHELEQLVDTRESPRPSAACGS